MMKQDNYFQKEQFKIQNQKIYCFSLIYDDYFMFQILLLKEECLFKNKIFD